MVAGVSGQGRGGQGWPCGWSRGSRTRRRKGKPREEDGGSCGVILVDRSEGSVREQRPRARRRTEQERQRVEGRGDAGWRGQRPGLRGGSRITVEGDVLVRGGELPVTTTDVFYRSQAPARARPRSPAFRAARAPRATPCPKARRSIRGSTRGPTTVLKGGDRNEARVRTPAQHTRPEPGLHSSGRPRPRAQQARENGEKGKGEEGGGSGRKT